MARGSPLIDVLNMFRAESRISANAAHNALEREKQVNLLQRKQEWLWRDHDWPHLRVDRFIELQDGQRFYDLPADLDIDRIQKVAVWRDRAYCELCVGIDDAQYTVYNSELDERSWPPRNWKISEDEMIEIWPVPDQTFDPVTLEGRMRVTGIRKLRPFVHDEDRADIDDRLIALHAAAEYLAALGAQDAQLKMDQAAQLYSKLRGQLQPAKKVKLFGATDSRPVIRVPFGVWNEK